jgi:hypothetical protein
MPTASFFTRPSIYVATVVFLFFGVFQRSVSLLHLRLQSFMIMIHDFSLSLSLGNSLMLILKIFILFMPLGWNWNTQEKDTRVQILFLEIYFISATACDSVEFEM